MQPDKDNPEDRPSASAQADRHGRLLAEFAPEGFTNDGSWQQRKSTQTRTAILEAAIDCLETHGYARMTTQLIAQQAGISRGAMLHHYATKQELVASLIDYVMYKRMEEFVTRTNKLSEDARVRQHAGMDIYWQSLLTREFAAYVELMQAARTDGELREILIPRTQKYDRIELEEVLRAFPEWAAKPDAYRLAMDYTRAAMEGLLFNREVWNDKARQKKLRDFISATVLMLREGTLPAPK